MGSQHIWYNVVMACFAVFVIGIIKISIWRYICRHYSVPEVLQTLLGSEQLCVELWTKNMNACPMVAYSMSYMHHYGKPVSIYMGITCASVCVCVCVCVCAGHHNDDSKM